MRGTSGSTLAVASNASQSKATRARRWRAFAPAFGQRVDGEELVRRKRVAIGELHDGAVERLALGAGAVALQRALVAELRRRRERELKAKRLAVGRVLARRVDVVLVVKVVKRLIVVKVSERQRVLARRRRRAVEHGVNRLLGAASSHDNDESELTNDTTSHP